MASQQEKYDRLKDLSRDIALLGGISELLGWDQETHMPPNGAGVRADHIGLMAHIIHERSTSAPYRQALEELVDLETGTTKVPSLEPQQQAAIKQWRRDFLLATKLPTAFVKRFAALTSEATESWRKARANNDFKGFAPHLEQIFDMCREKAELFGYTDSAYDPLLDEYEPGMTAAAVSQVFADLERDIVPLRKGLLAKPQPDTSFLSLEYPKEAQLKFARLLLDATGFTDENGAFDLTTHPFCLSLHPNDGRVTTRVKVNDPMQNFGSSLHEGGHYLYDTHLPPEHFGTPLCQAVSLGVHESQSRWWECLVGLSLPFWHYYYPKLQAAFPDQLLGVSLDQFYQAINALTNTPIRIESDEIAYPLHVILRFGLERDLIEGKLEVKDLPDAWSASSEQLLGITPKNDAEGCLQDVHWSAGLVGYFPTYALGNIYSAQLFEQFKTDHPDWDSRTKNGDFAYMRDWLKTHIHQYGRAFEPQELIERATGKPVTSGPYIAYLKKKFN